MKICLWNFLSLSNQYSTLRSVYSISSYYPSDTPEVLTRSHGRMVEMSDLLPEKRV